MKTTTIVILSLALIATWFTGSKVKIADSETPKIPKETLNVDERYATFYKFKDGDITCYYSTGSYSGGISCLK